MRTVGGKRVLVTPAMMLASGEVSGIDNRGRLA